MSHISRLKTIMVEREFLLEALDDLGYKHEEGDFLIKGISESTQAEIKVRFSISLDVGFRKTDQGYEIVADWWGVNKKRRQDFTQKIIQRYAYHAAKTKLETQGFIISAEEIRPGGQLHLVLRRIR